MFCEKCGHKIAEGEVFCSNCGAQVVQQKPEPPVQEVPVQQPLTEDGIDGIAANPLHFPMNALPVT